MKKQYMDILASGLDKSKGTFTVSLGKACNTSLQTAIGAPSSEILTEDHRKLIEKVKQYYLEFGVIPPVRILARHTGLSLGRIKELFPKGFADSFYRLAGIPAHVLEYTCFPRVNGNR